MRGAVWAVLALAAVGHALHEDGAYEEDEPRWSRREPDEELPELDDAWAEPPRARRSAEYERRRCCEYEYPEPPRQRRAAPARLSHYEVTEDTGEEPQWTAPFVSPDEMVSAAAEHRPRAVRFEEYNAAVEEGEEPGAPAAAHYLPPAADPDQEPDASAPRQHQAQHHAAGGGAAHGAGHHAANQAHGAKGYKSHEYSDKGAKGHRTKDLHRKEYEDAQGLKKQHRDNAGHQAHHEEQAHGHKGAKFDEKKGHKKGHKTKGYHNKYHKDEFHKEHKFYDDYHKGGSHHRYGKFHAKHASNESGRKKAHHVDAAHDATHKGTKGFSNKGHVDADHRGHKSKQGHEDHHAHQEAYGKKGGSHGGTKYAYAKN